MLLTGEGGKETEFLVNKVLKTVEPAESFLHLASEALIESYSDTAEHKLREPILLETSYVTAFPFPTNHSLSLLRAHPWLCSDLCFR